MRGGRRSFVNRFMDSNESSDSAPEDIPISRSQIGGGDYSYLVVGRGSRAHSNNRADANQSFNSHGLEGEQQLIRREDSDGSSVAAYTNNLTQIVAGDRSQSGLSGNANSIIHL